MNGPPADSVAARDDVRVPPRPWHVWVGEALVVAWACYTMAMYYRDQGFIQLLQAMVSP